MATDEKLMKAFFKQLSLDEKKQLFDKFTKSTTKRGAKTDMKKKSKKFLQPQIVLKLENWPKGYDVVGIDTPWSTKDLERYPKKGLTKYQKFVKKEFENAKKEGRKTTFKEVAQLWNSSKTSTSTSAPTTAALEAAAASIPTTTATPAPAA